jgi:hypothetical protein
MNINVLLNYFKKYYRIKTTQVSSLIKKPSLFIAIISILISILTIREIAPKLVLFSGPFIASIVSDSTNIPITLQKKQSISFLYDTRDSVSIDKVYQRNQFLINTLQQHQAIVAIFENAAIENRNQVRLYYITLLAAMITIFAIKKNAKKLILWCIIFIIPSMYLLDVHFSDLYFRHHKSAVFLGNAQDILVSISPSSNTYYSLNMDVLHSLTDSLKFTGYNRKLSSLIHPILEQGIYYILPLAVFLSAVIYYLLAIPINKKRKKTSQHVWHITSFPSRPHLRYSRLK